MSGIADKRALVTGGAGFIGSHLVERLAREGASVTVVDNLQAGSWANLGSIGEDVERLDADVRDPAAVTGIIGRVRPSFVFHLAANASVPGSVADPRYDFDSNAAGSFNVLEACRAAGNTEKIVVASSGAVYGEPKHFPLTEESPLDPISPYGSSKLCAETTARSFSSVYHTPAVVARIFNTYGPRMPRFVVFDFLKKLQKDPLRLEILGNGKQVRDLNYVSDTVEGLLAVATGGRPGETYNIASGQSHTVTGIAEAMLGILGLSGRTRLEFTGESWAGDAQRWEVDISKARALGYNPKVELSDGLARVAEWYEKRFGPLPLGLQSSS